MSEESLPGGKVIFLEEESEAISESVGYIVFVATIRSRFSQADFIIPATRRPRHEDGKFKAGLNYIV